MPTASCAVGMFVVEMALDEESGLLMHDAGLVVAPETCGGDPVEDALVVHFSVKFPHDGPPGNVPATLAVTMLHHTAVSLGLSLLSEVVPRRPDLIRGRPPLRTSVSAD